ncbi:MAG: DUF4019 domain-containing protein [Candidatus Competibacteraceae bacterium]|mgnify:CR=1 FL=1|nr:DUF4019 domain-containing protein [Candidatus Competibacteraceae bacterium]
MQRPSWENDNGASLQEFIGYRTDAGGADRDRAAVAAAESWLNTVDHGQYAASWQAAAAYFRQAVTPDQWVQSLQTVRQPLGERVSRQVQSATYQTALPGAPDGEYVVIQFMTVFTHKQQTIETVTPMKDADGAWRVSGYYLR